MELEILENTKMLLEIGDSEKDDILMFLVKDTIDAVMTYCRIEVLPRQLYGLIAQAAADIYRTRGSGDYGGAVKAVTEGERRVEFEDSAELFGRYASRLEPFMNKSARLPSQIEEARDEQS